ncbi:TetR/AcrR family transcriptional regulator [Microbacterium fluvii]|uniref:TetR/AcrR family transcriptional regulator n=1 Tax=Microbacterium fluvii TaxID=415215 RepID=A0ABW2HG63_9MICO|nr:TetR/AcrR family transcriptional regulator [Microbacterium fluvii]MCU4673584.1 TetR/AcrR family transcriptional regulator [Microbacterium fluvii]
MPSSYHHGDLRAQVLRGAATAVADSGPDALSLRDLARQVGVSHAAPAYHFGDRRGLFTALAVEGFGLLGDALADSVAQGAFDRTAVAYVGFAVAHPGHFAVMFRPALLDAADPDLVAAQAQTGALLDAGLDSIRDECLRVPRAQARAAAWALVHGVAVLCLSGALPDAQPEELALAAARQLFGE